MRNETIRIIAIIILISLNVALGETIWRLFSNGEIQPWLDKGYTLKIDGQWYGYYLGGHIQNFIQCVVIIRLSRMRPALQVAAWSNLCYYLFGLFMFAYNYNQKTPYIVFYSYLGVVVGINYYIFFIHGKFKKREVEVLGKAIRDEKKLAEKQSKERRGYNPLVGTEIFSPISNVK